MLDDRFMRVRSVYIIDWNKYSGCVLKLFYFIVTVLIISTTNKIMRIN